MAGSSDDRIEKRERVARVLAMQEGPLVLASHETLAWYLEGVRTHVSLAGPPVLAVRVERAGDTIFVADNEADRLIAEELLPEDAERVVRVPWWIPPAEAAAETPAAPESTMAGALRAARAAMLPAERERYRSLGRETAAVLTDVLALVDPDESERSVAGALAREMAARGIDPLVTLVSGADRLAYRHPLPTDGRLGSRAMVVVCGRRHGLIANATRWVGEGVDDAAILRVERAFLDASAPGTRLDEAFAAGTAAYASAGFSADEWRRHHQGGPTGYAGRDPRATPATTDLLVADQAFAWNPTAPGRKVEDTMLWRVDGWEVLTVDERWPTVHVDGLRRPVTLPFGG